MPQLFFASEGSPLSGPEDTDRLLANKRRPGSTRTPPTRQPGWFDAQDLPAPACAPRWSRIRPMPAPDCSRCSSRSRRGERLGRWSHQRPGGGGGQVRPRDRGRRGQVGRAVRRLRLRMERRLAGQGDPASASIKQLGMPADIAAGLRYQLIHRTVSILLEAQAIGAQGGPADPVVRLRSLPNRVRRLPDVRRRPGGADHRHRHTLASGRARRHRAAAGLERLQPAAQD